MSEKQGFMIIITAEDHKIIDLTMGDLLKRSDSWKKYQVGKRCCGSHQKTEGFGTDSRNNNCIVRHDYTEGCQMQNHQGVVS